jgi:hypothetical protein
MSDDGGAVSSGEPRAVTPPADSAFNAGFVAVTPERLKAAELLKKVLTVYGETQKIRPHPGSIMNEDDRYMVQYGSSMQALVVHRLLSVLDHLQLATFTLAQLPRPLVFSQFTLIRSALAGAATSLWIVDPPEIEKRRIRALRLACYDADQYMNFAKAALRDPAITGPEKASSRENFQGNIEKMNELRAKIFEEICRYLRLLGKTKMPSFEGVGTVNEISIVQAAGKKLEHLGIVPSDVHVELQYRILSGFVHNCLWASQTGATASSEVISRDGAYTTTTQSISGNAHNVFNGAVTAFEIVKLAKTRFEELASPASSA